MPEISLAGETALRATFDETPSATLTETLLAIARSVAARVPAGAIDAVPSYQTLTLHFDPGLIDREALRAALDIALEQRLPSHAESSSGASLSSAVASAQASTTARPVTQLPVWYDPAVAPDLLWLAEHSKLPVETVIARHTETEYHAYANGFAPGFCYLGDVPRVIAAPRLATPRRQVAAGSVGIADRQTAVYPAASPGGWRIIGRCPLRLFDITATPPSRVNIGDRVRFAAISRAEFIALGGQL